MLQRKRCVPFRRAAYVGGGIKMRPNFSHRNMTASSPLGLAPGNILVVEHSLETRSRVRAALEAAGHHVAEAGNPAGAREALRQCPPELVLCGIRFGAGESGLDFLSELTPRSPEIAVVMLTGDADTRVAIDCL